jgi:DNA-binding transcriptional ArsR family regulator
LVAREKPTGDEKICGKAKIGKKPVYFIDGFTSRKLMKKLLEGWCGGERWDSIGFTGSFLGIEGEVEVTIRRLRPLFKPGEEESENYIYRCTGSVEGEKFDVAVKRFLPRDPLDRGNREYTMMGALPEKIVPRVHGGVINHSLRVKGEPQLLVLFSDFAEGKNVGQEIWDLMIEITKMKDGGRDPREKIRRVHEVVKEAIDTVVFPFHRSSYDRLSLSEMEVGSSARRIEMSMKEMMENLRKLRRAGLLTDIEEERCMNTLSRAWGRMLSEIRVTKIHGDLMWGQIIHLKGGGMVILDLDEHMIGQPGKDIADLCAANRFIAETLPAKEKNFVVRVAEDLNKSIITSYQANSDRVGVELGKGLEESVSTYLAFRHLHDVAYHLPIWQGATDPAIKERHKRYVELSLEWFKRSVLELEGALARAP